MNISCIPKVCSELKCFQNVIKSFLFFVIVSLLTASAALALQPPRTGEIEKLKAIGDYQERLKFAEQLGNHTVDPDLVKRSQMRLQGQYPAPPPAWRGMPTKGNVKILALLIDFSDTPHVNAQNTINSKLFGVGVPSEYPRESLTNYYKRSSYNQLNISGSTLEWYKTSYPEVPFQ